MLGNPEANRIAVQKGGARATIGSVLFNDFWNVDDRISNIVTQLCQQKVLKQGKRGKLTVDTIPLNALTPWFFIKHGMFRDCLVWHQIYFGHFDFVPTGCQKCWKCVIVTNPDPTKQTVLDLFRLRDLMVSLQLPSKCGMDLRDYTPHRYDAYIYGDSLQQGLQYYEIMSQALKENGFPDAKVILKRGCTEMELKYPDSTQWVHTPQSQQLQMKLDSLIDRTEVPELPQENLTVQTVFRRWILRAYGIGDPTWRAALQYEGYEDPGEFLYQPPITYHDKTHKELYELFKYQQDTAGNLSFLEVEDG